MKTKGPGDAGQELVAVDFYEGILFHPFPSSPKVGIYIHKHYASFIEHLCTVPPGFNKGLEFTPEGKSRIVHQGDTTGSIQSFLNLVFFFPSPHTYCVQHPKL